MWSEGKVSRSDELFGSDSIKLSIDHSPVWIPVIKLVSLLNTPICLQNIPDVYKKEDIISNSVMPYAHKHTLTQAGHCPSLNEACNPTHRALLLKSAATGWVSQS